MNEFNNLGLSNELLTAIQEFGFEKPTDIQQKTIPSIILGKDVIGESSTGSGKTLAFGCGIVEKVDHGKGLQALILTPTRELAEQVKGVLNRLSNKKTLNIVAVYGGVSIGPQIHNLSKADVLVATPGRLLDHLQRKTTDISKIKLLVLDEADRMLDMGFIDDLKRIIHYCPKKRQTLLFSATITQRVKNLAKQYTEDPNLIFSRRYVDPDKLKQVYYNIERNLKLPLLVHLLQNEKSGLVMVFCNTRRNTDFVTKSLRANKINTFAIHGGLSQNKRIDTINLFNKSKIMVLVCTDVASRGLDIDSVSHIYNYDIPKDAKDYVHRIGRTARAGEDGKVINILCDYDHDNFSRITHEYPKFVIEKADRPYLKQIIAVKVDRERIPMHYRRKGNSYSRRIHKRYD